MAAVDPDDDSLDRWVVMHYRFDPERHERRYVAVAAFDDEDEYRAWYSSRSDELTEQIRAGSRDHRETLMGYQLLAGDRERAATGHAVSRAIEHGADPQRILDAGELPRNMGVYRAIRSVPEPATEGDDV